ncbi:BAX inhibitor (BI)-1/YccA family protein [Treponema phagedenis]|uniref:Bax inhibitor-1/YccA family protein n=1 Tax=Treponema phagedenis TaxID=162 RepID=A0A0B7GTJ5_TREPH|nr:Bax inhibitor-1/YccA family protein [Treponema phagedenis]NVP23862.1 Bax inhibitor-1/YccA family protein [Treponema phagedenis]QEJ99514.1 Bax inhibitor-1/YccA family protein [Treponema phagedenis]QEK02154.1 Bax inhibitor-1/YccA family protein [Treponema phagedenis]QEK05085.1 Bax inhibitor-1/YccA family protein [Treponema phagedenis]QEK07372.1 Bax inhibitor-1/YccA family protein [Treponema phagedenis]
MNETTLHDLSLQQANEKITQRFLAAVYGWMVAALAISGFSAFLVINSEAALLFIFGNKLVFFGLIIAEVLLVAGLSAGIRKISFTTAALAFIGYSILNGITLSAIFFIYTGGSITRIFLTTALMFSVMSIYGMTTNTDLNSAGRYLMMAVIGLVIASLVNMFLRSSSFDWLLSFITVGVFTGLTAYDSQKILQISQHARQDDTYRKVALIGALKLYLDFINIFLALLRLFGKKR